MDVPYLTPLNAEMLATCGVPAEWRFGLADRVRFDELDALAHVNNKAYLSWFEVVRVKYLSEYGFTTFKEASNYDAVLKQQDCSYHAPMFLDESYLVTARTVSFRNTSCRMEYGVFAPDLRAQGSALLVFVDRDTGAKVRIPDELREVLATRDGAVDES